MYKKTGKTGRNSFKSSKRKNEGIAENAILNPEFPAQKEKSGLNFDPEKTYHNLPLIVIAGRPNVGKSTLFNRFMKKRISITDPTPGVTRDPVDGTAFICGKPVHLTDTGGYKLDHAEGTKEALLDKLVVSKMLETLKKADRILLLLEAGQITGEDEEFIALLRQYWDKVIAAVNKTEGGRNEGSAWNYMKYGFKEIIFISAEHGDRIPELSEAIVKGLDFSKVTEGEERNPIRIAVLGKPNTGKSTLTNRLTHTEASIVSDYAGTTRDVVEGSFRYSGRDFQILDTAGIRRKARVTEDIEYYSVNRAIKTLDDCDIVFLVIDVRTGLAEQDKKICSLAYERGRAIIFVMNKWDAVDKKETKFKDIEKDIRIMFAHMNFAPILPLSAKEGDGIKLLMDTAIELYGQLSRKIDTSALNTALKDWLFKYPPPASKTLHFHIRYMTQKSVNPVGFIIFATRPEVVPQTYIAYLKNRIREDLGFSKIPVQLEMKASRVKWEKREKKLMAQYTIGDVEELTGLKAHVLRYWEEVIPGIRPKKDLGGRRVYTQREIDVIQRLKYLIYEKKFTIEGARDNIIADMNVESENAELMQNIREARKELTDIFLTVRKYRVDDRADGKDETQ